MNWPRWILALSVAVIALAAVYFAYLATLNHNLEIQQTCMNYMIGYQSTDIETAKACREDLDGQFHVP